MIGRPSRRLARAARTRRLQMRRKVHRLLVHMSGRHTYAQVVAPDAKVVASASTVEKEVRAMLKGKGADVAAAKVVGARIAERILRLDAPKLAFDRGGRRYHGRVRALAEAARAGGLTF